MADSNEFDFGKAPVIVISDKAFDKLTEILDNPPEPTQALIDLMKRPKRWATKEEEKA